MKEISFFAINGFRLGHCEDVENATGVSVFLFDTCMPCGVDIRGGGSASRETPLLLPTSGASGVHALVFSGGSAFGLDASGGVMEYLEEQGIGFDVGVTKVPLICQSSIFDLALVNHSKRPSKEMAYRACCNAKRDSLQGNVGVGIGASVGKLLGMDYAMKAGIGFGAYEYAGVQVGAFVVVNAVGDVFDIDTGEKLAGMYDRQKQKFLCSDTALLARMNNTSTLFDRNTLQNTTLGAVLVTAPFSKAELTKIASITQNALAKTISPVHTMADGDTVYAVSLESNGEKADINAVALLAQKAMEKAIKNACLHSAPCYGLPSYQSIM